MLADGTLLGSAVREHQVERPHSGHVEMDMGIWWDEFCSITQQLLAEQPSVPVAAVGVSGMGPCVGLTDDTGVPLRPAILYGVDMRATREIAALHEELGRDQIIARCGSALSTQAVGPKLEWINHHEPEIAKRADMMFMPSSWLAYQLTGSYVLDHHSASQCTPMYDSTALTWHAPWFQRLSPSLRMPELAWPGDIIGSVSTAAAEASGLPPGLPVIAGTIDAWSEAISVGAHEQGDLMLMYGTTMFLILTTPQRQTSPILWGTVGAFPHTYNLAAGMATSGAITSWLRGIFGDPDFSTLVEEADTAGVGARGLLMLPYFAGERTPIADPDARGTIIGLTLDHTRGDLYRAALEATAFGVRHNIEAFNTSGAEVKRLVAVGGGTQGGLWPQIVSDVTGLDQTIRSITVGASLGAAFLAAQTQVAVSIDDWNPISHVVEPDPSSIPTYDHLYGLYRDLYPSTQAIAHDLSAFQAQHR